MTNVVQCSRTLAAHFPPAVYRSVGSSQVLPELTKSLDIANVQCIQFIPNGVVRVTFKESAQCDAALAGGVSFRGSSLRVTPVDARTRLVYLRDLPVEVPDEPVRAFFRKFGVLHSLSPQFHPGWPDVKNGTRVAKVTLLKDLPSSVRIAGYDARLWYQGQPQSCPVCAAAVISLAIWRASAPPAVRLLFPATLLLISLLLTILPPASMPPCPMRMTRIMSLPLPPSLTLVMRKSSVWCPLLSCPRKPENVLLRLTSPPLTFGTTSCLLHLLFPVRLCLPLPWLLLILRLPLLFLILFPVRLSLPLPWFLLFLLPRLGRRSPALLKLLWPLLLLSLCLFLLTSLPLFSSLLLFLFGPLTPRRSGRLLPALAVASRLLILLVILCT